MTLDQIPLGLAAAALVAGIAAGWAHFASLRHVADLFAAGRMRAIGLQLARLAALGVFFWLCTRGGSAVLIAGVLGVLIGRVIALKRGGLWTRR